MCIYNYNSINYNTNTIDEVTYDILKQIFESIDANDLNNAKNLTKELIQHQSGKSDANISYLEEALNKLM